MQSLPGSLAHDIWRHRRHPLDAFFKPQNVAVVGATEAAGSVGRTILWNLLSSPFGGTVFPVNPKRPSILGVKAYPSIGEVPGQVDLAVVVTPASAVPSVIADAGRAGVRAAIVISAGFKELGPPGEALEGEVLAEAQRSNMRIVGPNCLGIMNPLSGLNATFSRGMARPGNVAFLSQSGALLTAILDWSQREQVGFSGFVSTGSMLDVGWGDLIDYFGSDPRTHAIMIYMESIGDARSFLSAAREVALSKPIIVIKPGRTEAAAKAAASHTGSLTGSDEVLEAAFRRVGVLRVSTIAELFHMADVLAKQPRPAGRKLTILTNAGGPAVLATDALIAANGELGALSEATLGALDDILPAAWSHANPVDILGDAGPERYAQALQLAAKDPNSDGLLVILTPQDMTDPTLTAEALSRYAKSTGKPVLASWMGGPTVAAGAAILNGAGIPSFQYPDSAARAFCYMWQSAYSLRALYETPTQTEGRPEDPAAASAIISEARREGRTLLDEYESKRLLAAYGIPTVATRVARDADAAVRAAEELGFPVVVKLHSRSITHKSDVGGVRLDLKDAGAVREAFAAVRSAVESKAGAGHFEGVTVQAMVRLSDAYELILGSSDDPQFGPVLLFGSGGQLVEVYRDRALGLPPLNKTLARRMMEQTRVYHALHGVRGRAPVNLEALASLLVNFSHLIVEQRWIKELDINPLLASPEGLVALDARVVLHPEETPEDALPRPAIRPYPNQYAGTWRAPDGEELQVRPICPEDEPALVEFHQALSETSVRFRYFQPLALDERTAHERLSRVCFSDYDRDIALVAERRQSGLAPKVVAVGRLAKTPGQRTGEFAIMVTDAWQGRGLGTELLRRIVRIGKEENLETITADVLSGNVAMRRTCEKVGFTLRPDEDESLLKATIRL